MITVIAPVYNINRTTLETADSELIAGNIIDTVKKRADSAPTLKVSSDSASIDAGGSVITVTDGYLTYDGAREFAAEYYNGKTIGMTAKQLSDTSAEVTITVSNKERQLCSRTTVISSLAGILGKSSSAAIPSDMIEKLNKAIAEKKSAAWNAADIAFKYLRDDLYGGTLPTFDRAAIIADDQIKARLSKDNPGATSDEAKFLNYLLGADKITLSGFVTKKTFQPIVYLTNNPSKLDTQSHSSVVFLYHDGAWYYPKSMSFPFYLPSFNEKTADQINTMIADRSQWIPVSEL